MVENITTVAAMEIATAYEPRSVGESSRVTTMLARRSNGTRAIDVSRTVVVWRTRLIYRVWESFSWRSASGAFSLWALCEPNFNGE